MAKTATSEPDVSQKDEARRQRKKQAKQEAKTMLKIERAKKDVKKAQKKVTRAQSTFDESQAHLHNLEEKLQQIRSPQEDQNEEAPASQTSPVELPELQPEDFKTQEVSSEAYQEPLLLDNTPATDGLAQNESNVSVEPSEELTTPSPETVAETDTTSPEETSDAPPSADEYESLVEHGNEEPELSNNPNASPPEEELTTSTPSYSAQYEESAQEENQQA